MTTGDIRLGSIAHDTATYFRGTVTAIVVYLGDSTRIQLSRLADDSGAPQEEWFDVGRIVLEQSKP